MGEVLVRHRHGDADTGRVAEIVPVGPLVDLGAPEHGPGHARDREEEDEAACDDPRHRVQIPPEYALARLAAHGEHAAALPARPPQIEAGEHEQDGPAADDLDDAVRHRSEIGEAVQLADNPHHGAAIRDLPEHARVIGVDIDHHPRAGGVADRDLGGSARGFRRHVFYRLAGEGLHRLGDDLGRRPLARRAGLDLLQVAMDQAVDLGPEEVESTGHGQQDEKGQGDQSGIEMPAPDGAIEGCGASVRALGRGRRRGDGCHGRILV
ncbi:hypothetical protein BTHI11S_03371 [Bosea thiooxidans]